MTESTPQMEPKVKELKSKEGPSGGKVAAMTALQQALAETRIATAKVWNPWAEVCETGIDRTEIQGTPGLTAAPQTIPEDQTFASFTGAQKRVYAGRMRQLAKDFELELTEDTLATAKLLMKTEYLQWGRANWKGFAGGNCTAFAGVTAGFLAENMKLVPSGATVEQFNLSEGGQGHAFLVIGRDPSSKPGTPATWGDKCFIVDQWYARQRVSAPGKYAVKDSVGSTSDFSDEAFWKFLSTGRISRGPAYTYEQMTTLR
jgi:hypothetical protein